MTAFGPDRANDVLAQCQASIAALSTALADAFEGEIEVLPAEPAALDVGALSSSWAGGGLVFAFTLDDTPCLAVLADTDGLIPEWCRKPDDAGRQKLQQLGAALTASLSPGETKAQHVGVTFREQLDQVLDSAQPTADSMVLPCEISRADIAARLSVIWPVAQIEPLFTVPTANADEPIVEDATGPASQPDPTATTGKLPKHRRLIYRNLEDGIRQLPAYAQSLLRVQVPVSVTLATAKSSVSNVLDMGPGTILQFKKACDSNLTMEVGRQTVAEGEAVKVGDKFGFWITSMTKPDERFWLVNKTAPGKRVK